MVLRVSLDGFSVGLPTKVHLNTLLTLFFTLFLIISVAAALEEICEARKLKGDSPPFDYEPHTVRIRSSENLSQFFSQMNPTQKIPVIQDGNGVNDDKGPVTVFESGAILLYLAERYGDLLNNTDMRLRYQTIEWTFWGSSELSVQCKLFGFYYKYCEYCIKYPITGYLSLFLVLTK